MKIGIAQIKPIIADIGRNIDNHVLWAAYAAAHQVKLVMFPELSLTGYEPKLAAQLATTPNAPRLTKLQRLADKHKITICAGLPTPCHEGICISMVIFQPNRQCLVYSKQQLHEDELPYFVHGSEQILLEVAGTKAAPAICYESLQPIHAQRAASVGIDLYLASVAKAQKGVDKAMAYYPTIANRHNMIVMMANAVGACDNFESAGQSGVWDESGTLLGQLTKKQEGLLVYDMHTKAVTKINTPLSA